MPVICDVTTSNGAYCLPLSSSTVSLPYTSLKIVLYFESYFYRIYATSEAPKGIRKASAELNEALWSTKAKPQKLFRLFIENVHVYIHARLSTSSKETVLFSKEAFQFTAKLHHKCIAQSKEKHYIHLIHPPSHFWLIPIGQYQQYKIYISDHKSPERGRLVA